MVMESTPVLGGAETILVAEDDEQVRVTVVETLSELGYHVLKANDASSALAIIESGVSIDLLFTDVVMPEGMSGHQLAATARRLRPGLRVLFATGYAGVSEPDGQHLLHKPYDRRDLARAVRTALDAMAEPA